MCFEGTSGGFTSSVCTAGNGCHHDQDLTYIIDTVGTPYLMIAANAAGAAVNQDFGFGGVAVGTVDEITLGCEVDSTGTAINSFSGIVYSGYRKTAGGLTDQAELESLVYYDSGKSITSVLCVECYEFLARFTDFSAYNATTTIQNDATGSLMALTHTGTGTL